MRISMRILGASGLSMLGMLAAHSLDYRLLSQEAGPEHGYLSGVLRYVPFIAIAAGVAVIGAGLSRRRAVKAPRLMSTWTWLAIFQSFGFVLVEVLERLLVGAPVTPATLLIVVGIPIQIAVALVVASLCLALHRIGELLAIVIRSGALSTRLSFRPTLFSLAYVGFAELLRGPPRAALM